MYLDCFTYYDLNRAKSIPRNIKYNRIQSADSYSIIYSTDLWINMIQNSRSIHLSVYYIFRREKKNIQIVFAEFINEKHNLIQFLLHSFTLK